MIQSFETMLVDVPTIRPHRMSVATMNTQTLVLKDRIHDLDHLVSAITAVAAGECHIDAQLVDQMMGRRRSQQRSPLAELTPRQREILAVVAQGKSNLAIAREFGLTQRAVEKHVSEVFGRLGLASDEAISRRVQATLLFLSRREQ